MTRYTREEKAEAVTEAVRTSIVATAQRRGIPERTVGYWFHASEFADLRDKTRDELAGGALLGAHMALSEILDRIRSGKIDSKSLVTAFGVFVDKAQLLTGMATARTESRDITGTLSDSDLVAALREADAITGGAGAASAPSGEPEG
jgi:hypothetical protein